MHQNTEKDDFSIQNLNALESNLLSSGQGSSELSTDNDIDPVDVPAAPGILRFLPPMIQDFWNKQAYFQVESDGSLLMRGFYKAQIKLNVLQDGTIEAIDKRGTKTKISSFEDLVRLNHFWWKASSSKSNYVHAERPWVDHFLKMNLAKRKVLIVPIDENGEEI